MVNSKCFISVTKCQPTPEKWQKNENKDTFEIKLYYFVQGCFLEPQLLEKPLVLAWLVSENKYKTVLNINK